tara:strand:- start:113 stop:418 length:306 start_codon:yes stop_codon:yes gene_type:complete
MNTSTFHELNTVLLGLHRAVQKTEITQSIEEIDTQIAYHQNHRHRITGGKWTTKGVSGHDHSFKLRGNKNFNEKQSDEYDNHYYEIINLRCKKKILMDMQA